jgi:nucleotide-binding universal stress UspA family protein
MQNPKKNVLVAIDGSENALAAVRYTADMLLGLADMKITLFHIRLEEVAESAERVRVMMLDARGVLVEAGIPPDCIHVKVAPRREGVARDILAEIASGGYGTVVIGRRGLSRAAQFLFGGVTNKVVSNAKNCTLWVVD